MVWATPVAEPPPSERSENTHLLCRSISSTG
ncbi:hypothetical protein AVEN_29974-1, partial [Araneus ventricosus]